MEEGLRVVEVAGWSEADGAVVGLSCWRVSARSVVVEEL